MIIGINGKIGSGKDTVGEIIQGLCLTNKNQTFEIKKFAGKLKQIASILTGVPVEKFEDQEFKKQYMPEEWSVEIWNDPDPIEDNDYRITSRIKYEGDTSLITYNDGLSEAEVFDHEIKKRLVTYREFLQKLGTETMRNGLHENTWVNALFANYIRNDDKLIKITEENLEEWQEGEYPNWIITDMRFPNEMEAVEKRHGITIRVNRTTFRTTETEFGKLSVVNQPKVDKLLGIQEHPSETALDDGEFDYEIINDGSINDLVQKVRQILVKEGLI